MRIAALYDIHGNLPALEAVLDDVRRASVDRIIVGGDVFPGPMAREALACLRALETPVDFIRGNGDRAVVEQRAGGKLPEVPEVVRPSLEWTASELSDDDLGVIASWPLSVPAAIDGVGTVLFCHATPRDDNETFTQATLDDRVRPMFAGVDAQLVVCGHTHRQFDRTLDGLRIVNAGSVGMPFGERGAFWLLIDREPVLRCTEYDRHAAAERLRRTGYPRADEFVSSYVV